VRIIRCILRVILPPVAVLLAPVFALIARTGYGVEICRRLGFHPLRLHYYQPIPKYESAPGAVFVQPRSLPGFGIDRARVAAQLKELARFGGEAQWTRGSAVPGSYTPANENFGFSSAALLHAFIRASGARKVIEIGGGYSSLVSMAALEANHGAAGFRFVCVEPYASGWLRSAIGNRGAAAMLVEKPAQALDAGTLADLAPGDILFIDSSHCVHLASDVNFLFLEVLPRLKRGVMVHIHDVYVPYEYPREHFFGPNKKFWNEQYLLEALLTENPHWEILLPAFMVQTEMQAEFRAAFPHYDPSLDRKSSSFWMRRVG
jgi:hypothetical protein